MVHAVRPFRKKLTSPRVANDDQDNATVGGRALNLGMELNRGGRLCIMRRSVAR